MRKVLFLLFILLCPAVAAYAQKINVTGRIIEKSTSEALPGATAVLLDAKDSVQVNGAAASDNGQFRITAVKAGNYILRIGYMGYKTIYQNLTLKKNIDVGTIGMEEDAKMMSEANVVARLAQVEMKADTFVYNADAFRVPEGAMLEELVKKLPGAEVDDDGTIKINGKSVKKILVDGKEFFADNTKMSMKNLPTKMINKIKAYDKKSDYSRVTGIDDGEEETVLDLSVKKGMKEGWIVNLDGGYGTHDRYTARANVNRFMDNRQFSVIGSVNNVNDQGMPGGGGGRFGRGGGGGGGIVSSQMGGANFAWENGKPDYTAGLLKLGGSVFFNRSSADRWSFTNSQTFLNDGTSTWSNSISQGNTINLNVRANFRMEWMPDSMTNIIFRPNYSYSQGRSNSESVSMTFNKDPYKFMSDPLYEAVVYDDFGEATHELTDEGKLADPVNHSLAESLSRNYSHSADASLQVNRRLGIPGRNITFNINGGYSHSDNKSWNISDIHYYQKGTSTTYTNRYNLSPSTSWNIQPRISYTEPITRDLNLQFSYQFQYRYNDGRREMYDLHDLISPIPKWKDASGEEFMPMDLEALKERGLGYVPGVGVVDTLNFILNEQNSQYSTYNEYNHDAQILTRYTHKFSNDQELRFNAGVSFQPQRTDLDYKKDQVDTVIVRNVYNWAPRLNLRWKISKTSQLRANYWGGMSQPGMTNLIEVMNNSNPQNVSIGNSGLESSWSNRFFMQYNDYLTEKQMGWAVNMNFNQTQRSISSATIYDKITGNHYTRPMNINGNWNIGGDLMFNTALDQAKHFSINTNTNLNYSNNVGYISSSVNVLDILSNAGSSTTDLNNITLDDMHMLFDNALNNGLLQTATTKTMTVGEWLRGTYRTEWGESGSLEFGLNGGFNYMHARNQSQPNGNMDTWNFNYGGNIILTLPFGMSISTDFGPQYRRGYNDENMNTTELIWNAQISQSFLKKKSLTISAQAFDLLQQRSNISRNISATMRSDTQTNAINSYFMFKVSYRLNLMGNKEARSAMRGPGAGGPPPEGFPGGRPGGRPGGGGPGGRF